jgi:nitrile hydratase accessory protein
MTPATLPEQDTIDLSQCPGLPLGALDTAGATAAPVFAEPWQAQAFAMTLQLHQRGLFTWPEWASALTHQIQLAQARGDADLGNTYYHHWLAVLESLVITRGAASAQALHQHAKAWEQAAERTPHGQPIHLQAADFVSGPAA